MSGEENNENLTNEIPVSLLKLTSSEYQFHTVNGYVRLSIPSSLKRSEYEGVREMFDLIFRQMERNVYED